MSIPRVSPYTPPSCKKYDVFLSFRGEDTRKSFTDHLYAAFKQKGIYVFKDDEELNRGKPISPELLQAIAESRFSIIVFSKNYASSIWCLNELVKIVECMKTRGQTAIPVFYDVDPSDVRKQTGDFHEAFSKHEEAWRENKKTVETWRSALTEVANLSGWDLKDRPESEFIQEIVKQISTELSPSACMSFKNLVGIDSRWEKLKILIGAGSHDVRMIGICGMGGIGKTTIARVAYEFISGEFEGRSFLANVREISKKDGLFSLQKVLLSQILGMKIDDINVYNDYDGISMIRSRLQCKKVLMVIDDVDHSEQLNKLAAEHDWFGPGSRIIITSRVKNLLTFHGIDEVYNVDELNSDEALQMLVSKAFKKSYPSENFLELCKCVVKYAGGLPLALEVLSSFLFGREFHVWEDALKRLKSDSKQDILDRLQISFDGLEESEKNIFLDIACFFKGMNRNDISMILESCGFFPNIGIDELINKSLITISNNYTLWMHDLLEEMGRRIVKRESFKEPGKRSRLWDEVDIHHVLTRNTGTEAIEGIKLNMSKISEMCVDSDAFKMMSKLRFLDISCSHDQLELNPLFFNNRCDKNCSNKVHAFQSLHFTFSDLVYFRWHGYPLKSLPSRFNPNNLVALVMPHSEVEQLWSGTQRLGNLKHINLSYSKHLTEIPDLSQAPNLESLVLEGCRTLIEISSSIQDLNKVAVMNLSNCKSLSHLPSRIRSKALKSVDLSGCSNLYTTPSFPCNMKYLDLSGTAISEFPMIEDPSRLVSLTLYQCSRLENLPSRICKLEDLYHLDLTGCSKLESLPNSICELKGLYSLYLTGCSKLESLPSSICELKGLHALYLTGCSKLESLPSSICELKSLHALYLTGCSKLESLPNNICELKALYNLDLTGCSKLKSLPSSICKLKGLHYLYLTGCSKLDRLPDELGDLEHLHDLKVDDTAIREVPISIARLKKLYNLSFKYCENQLPKGLVLHSFSALSSLRNLTLSGCGLTELPDSFDQLTSLRELYLGGNNFEKIPAIIKNLHKLSFLWLSGCKRLQSLRELKGDGQLEIDLHDCVALEDLSDLSWSWIYKINFSNCIKLDENAIGNKMKDDLWRYQQGFHRIRKGDICFPGNEIPEWFGFQAIGSSMKMKLPPDWYNENFRGFAICAVVGFPDHKAHTHVVLPYYFYTKSKCSGGIEYDFLEFTTWSTECYYEDHVFLAFNVWNSGSPYFYPYLDNLNDECVDLSEDNEAYIKFKTCAEYNDEWIYKVKKCGIHLVYGPDNGKSMEEPSTSFNISKSFQR